MPIPLNQIAFALGATLIATQSFAQHADVGPFSGLSGHWAGAGVISLGDGSTERIHCRATYSVDAAGRSLVQQLRCASDSYRLEISANVRSQGGVLSGSWSEAAHGESGSVSGSASGSTIRAQVRGGSFSAGIGIHTSGAAQSVTITPSAGTDVRSVTITMRRG